MAIDGFDPQYFHKALSEFWLDYEEKDWLNKYWESICQVIDEEYLELYHANFSKGVMYCPIYTRTLWLNFVFEEDDWIENRKPHDHKYHSFTAVGGETNIPLPFDTKDSHSMVFKNGVLLEYARQYYLIAFNDIGLVDPAVAGDFYAIEYSDYVDDQDTHSHKIWQEYLLFDKQNWTNDPGDVFAVHGEYDPLATFPLAMYVDGVRLKPSEFTMVSSTLITTPSTVPSGSKVIIVWENDTEDEIHNHLKNNTWYPAGATVIDVEPLDLSNNERIEDRFAFNMSDDYVDGTKRDLVWIGGLLKTKDENTTITNADYRVDVNKIVLATPLAAEESIMTQVYDPGYSYYNSIDSKIIRLPALQDGADIYENKWTEYEDFEVKNGMILSNIKFENVWSFETYINDEVPYYNFGEPIDFYRQNDSVYLGMVQALWRAYFSGPRVYITEEACKMLLGVPFTIAEDRISKITDNGAIKKDYNVEFDGGASYDLNYPLEPRFNEGDVVKAYETLSNGVDIYDAVNNPNWYKRYTAWLEFFEQFYYNADGLPFASVFDDSFIFDDGGRFDHMDYRFLPQDMQDLYKERLFQALKHFVFAVDIEIDIIPSVDRLDDVRVFLDRIKPAYTTYIIIATKTIKDEIQKNLDRFEATFELVIKDYFPAPEKHNRYGVIDHSVVEKGLSTPPATPTLGDYYIIGAGAIDDWAGHDNELARWNTGWWDFFVPGDGESAYVQIELKSYVWNGAEWTHILGDAIHNPYMDDGGLFDIEYEQVVSFGVPGQTEITISTFSVEEIGWTLLIDEIAKTYGVDWSWTDDTHRVIQLTVPLVGGEDIKVYRDNGSEDTLDKRALSDYVSFELTP